VARRTASFGSVIVFLMAAMGVLQFLSPSRAAATAPFAAIERGGEVGEVESLGATPSLNAFGSSRGVKLRFALPGRQIEFPLEVTGDLEALTYEWVSLRDSSGEGLARPLGGESLVAPIRPGFYQLAIIRGVERQIITEPTVAVMVPFGDKVGGTLNGYRIGTYIAEKLHGGTHDRPSGFLEVARADLNLKVSRHMRLGDFVTHDGQADVWPKYVALNPRLLDKIELVLAKIGSRASLSTADSGQDVALDVHSGFRTPAHNRGVQRAARDSRHQYGDAADVAIDADGDGRVTLKDEILVARAVDEVEDEHPELVGGLGLYTSHRYRSPYVHIDARGKRSRWRG
jgi:uncharacterized protein YcbK (DUF882 family)